VSGILVLDCVYLLARTRLEKNPKEDVQWEGKGLDQIPVEVQKCGSEEGIE